MITTCVKCGAVVSVETRDEEGSVCEGCWEGFEDRVHCWVENPCPYEESEWWLPSHLRGIIK